MEEFDLLHVIWNEDLSKQIQLTLWQRHQEIGQKISNSGKWQITKEKAKTPKKEKFFSRRPKKSSLSIRNHYQARSSTKLDWKAELSPQTVRYLSDELRALGNF